MKITMTGNPDIRVPDVIESEDGLRTTHTRLQTQTPRKERRRAAEERRRPSNKRRKKNQRTPEQEIPLRDRKDPRSSNAATSQEGRGSVRYSLV
ncbi:hypothetical protein NDU88_004574 [Pleurodeles waltl]|uniref:Uncharacterized protein n=1 Tax=Pleurodeles waltl TaxID=8319 RepID=A0AAV7KY51_PLEWA|nr:hypothetical protein NDU88_004574 [Pleurodeles waltl]